MPPIFGVEALANFFSANFSSSPLARLVDFSALANVGVPALLVALELLRLLTLVMFGGVFKVISSSSESTSITVGVLAGVDLGVFCKEANAHKTLLSYFK